VFALSQDGHAVAYFEDFVELVRDYYDSAAFFFHLAQDAEKLLYLLSGENGGRFVQNKDIGAVIKDFDYFEGLLFADSHIADLFAGIEIETEITRYFVDFLETRRT